MSKRDVVVLGGGPIGNRHIQRLAGRYRAGGTGRHGDEGGSQALRGRPEGDQLRHRRQHHSHRIALGLRGARGLDSGRSADEVGGHGRQPAPLVGPAGHRHDRAEHPAGRLRLRHRWRRRGDEPWRLPVAGPCATVHAWETPSSSTPWCPR